MRRHAVGPVAPSLALLITVGEKRKTNLHVSFNYQIGVKIVLVKAQTLLNEQLVNGFVEWCRLCNVFQSV